MKKGKETEITIKESELRKLLNERDDQKGTLMVKAQEIHDLKKTEEYLTNQNKELQKKLEVNSKTEFCWSCVKEIPVKEFDLSRNDFRKGICNRCIEKQDHDLKRDGYKVIETDRKPQYSGWHQGLVTITDVFLEDNSGKRFFIRGYRKGESPHDTEVFCLINQFLKTDGNYIGADPFKLLTMMNQYGYTFGRHYECHLHKLSDGRYEFGGNLQEVSNAFNTYIYNRSFAELLSKTLQGMKYIFVSLDKSIFDYKDELGISSKKQFDKYVNLWDYLEEKEKKK